MQRPTTIAATLMFVLLCLGGCSEPAGKPAEAGKGQQQITPAQQEGAATKLGGPARDLNAPLEIGALPATNKPVVLIYYINETAPDEAERKNLEILGNWLREDGHPEIAPHADSIDFDTKKFPRVVDADLAVLREQHAKANDKRPNIVIFTNRLAQQGKFQVLDRDVPGVLKEQTFNLPSKRVGLYGPYPLASRESLAQALQATAALFPAKDHEYALITKSHGSGDIVVAPRYQVVVEESNREAFLKQINAEHQASLIKKLQGAVPLFAAPDKKLSDGKGRSLISKNGLIYWEGIGRVYLSGGKQGAYLVDRAGTAFATPEGKKILVDHPRLVIEGTTQNILEAKDKPVELLAILASGMNLLNLPDKDILPASMRPQLIPLLRSKATAGVVLARGGMALPALEGDKATTPILEGDKGTTPILEGDKGTTPILNTDKATTPILESDKLSVPSLYYDGTLAAGQMDKNGGDTPRHGIFKDQLVDTLNRSHEGADMVFRLVFMESCASELPSDLVQKLQSPERSKSIGQIWSSDSRGLEYTTIGFGKVFERLATSPGFIDALQAELNAKYESDKAGR